MSAHKKKKSKKHKKRRIREENSEAIESLSYAYLKGREVEGGDSSQPLQLWVSLGISTKGKSGLLATGEVSAPNESVGETAFEDDLEQMESDEGAVRSSLKSSIDSAEVQMVNEDKQRKKAKKKKKKSHKRGPTLEKDSIASSTESHKGGDGGMDVSFPLSALKGSWKKTKQTSSSKVGGKDLKRMMQQDEEDVEESVQTPIQVTSGKRLRYWSEESDGVSKEKRLCEESPDEEDEGTIGGLEIDAPEKEEYSPVFIEPENMGEAYHSFLRHILSELKRRDIGHIFSEPVTDDIAPGYSSLISHPMDMSTMGQKILFEQYPTIKEFREDFVLMCKNAMTYNTADTIYHQAAKKYLALGLKIIIKELESRPDIRKRYGIIPEMEPPPSTEFPLKPTGVKINTKGPFVCRYSLKMLKKLYAKKTKNQAVVEPLTVQVDPEFEAEVSEVVVDDSSTTLHIGVCGDVVCDHQSRLEEGDTQEEMEEMIQQMMSELEEARTMQEEGTQQANFCFLNKDSQGYTSMNILNPDSNVDSVNVDMTGLDKLVADGRASKAMLENERQRLREKPITFLMYGPYGSFAPSMSSTFATLSKMDTDLLYTTYGDDLGVTYSHSLQQFAQGTGSYIEGIAESLLNGLTSGRHKAFKSKLQKECEVIVKKETADKIASDSHPKERRSSIEKRIHPVTSSVEAAHSVVADVYKSSHAVPSGLSQSQSLQQTLNETAGMIVVLQQKQNQRLVLGTQDPNHRPPLPSADEKEIAYSILNKLKDLSSLVRPEDLVSRETLHRAMGIALRSVEHSEQTGDKPHPPSAPKDESQPSSGPKVEPHPPRLSEPKDKPYPQSEPKNEVHPLSAPKDEPHPPSGPKDVSCPLSEPKDEPHPQSGPKDLLPPSRSSDNLLPTDEPPPVAGALSRDSSTPVKCTAQTTLHVSTI